MLVLKQLTAYFPFPSGLTLSFACFEAIPTTNGLNRTTLSFACFEVVIMLTTAPKPTSALSFACFEALSKAWSVVWALSFACFEVLYARDVEAGASGS